MNLKRFLCFFLVIAMMLTTVMPAAATEPAGEPVIIEGENVDIINDETPDEPSEESTEEPTEESAEEPTEESSEEPAEESTEETTEGGETEIAPAAVDPVAKVGETSYETLADAIANVTAGDTITLLADVTEDITVNKSVTIDGAGKTYTGQMKLTNGTDITIKNVNFDGKGYNGYAVETRGAAYLTIEDCTAKNYGYGFVQLASGTALTTVKNVTVSDCAYGVKVDYSNAVVLEKVKLNCTVAGVLNSNYGEKTITIKDSNINILGTWTRNNTTKTKVVFEGDNSIDEFIIDAAIDNFVLAEGATLTAPNDITLTNEAGQEIVYENGTYSVVEKVYAAQVGKTKYETLAEAVAAANEAGKATIELLSDVTLGEKLTISGNVTITGTSNTTGSAQIGSIDKLGPFTISRADSYTGTLFAVNSGATLTLDGGLTIDGGNNWTLNTALYNQALNREVEGVTWAQLITSEEGAPNAAAAMFVVNGAVNANKVTIQNNYSTKDSNSGDGGVFKVVGANAALTMNGAQIKHIVTGGANSVAYLSNAVWTMNKGSLITDTFAARNGGICRNDSGKFVMNGGEISNNKAINTNGTVFMMYGGSFEMKDGKICSNTGIAGSDNSRAAAIYLHSNGKMTMSGGEICHNTGIGYGGIDSKHTNSALTITGGYVGENKSVVGNPTYDVNMPGNTVISGGTFTQDVSKWLADDYGLVKNEDGTYGVKYDPTYGKVAKLGETYYKTLQEAVDACTTGDNTITLLADIDEDVTIKQAEGINIVIDGAQKSFSGTFTIHGAARYTGEETLTFQNILFSTSEAGHYFIDSNSTASAERYAHNVTVDKCYFEATGDAVNSAAAMRIRQGYNIKLSRSYFVGMHSALQAYGCAGVTAEGLEISGGKNGISLGTSKNVKVADCKITATGYGIRADGTGAYDATVIGCTINAELPIVVRNATGAYELTVTKANLTATNENGYQVIFTNGDDGTYEAPTGAFVANVDENIKVYPVFVAQVGEAKFVSLEEAVAAADGATVTLIDNVTEDVTVNKSVTIDGAGKTYTGKMTLKADTTIKNVNFDGKGYNGYAVETRGANYLTIEDCTAKNYGYGFVQLASGTALTTVKNVTVSDCAYGVKVDYSNAVVLDNVDLNCSVAGLLNSNYGEKTITIKNSDISILGTWVRNNTIETTYVFEGVNSIDEFIIDAAIDNFKLAADATLTAPNDITVTTDVADHEVEYNNGVYSVVEAGRVAMIGDTQYKTLALAIAAANAGNTITLIDNVTEDVTVNKSVTIDGANFNYTGKMNIASELNVTIRNVNFVKASIVEGDNVHGSLTIKGCTFDGVDKSIGYAITVDGISSLVIEDTTAKNYSTGMVYSKGSLDTISVKNVSVENVAAAFNIKSCNVGTFEKVTVMNATYGIHSPNYGNRTFTLIGCKFDCANPTYVPTKTTAIVTFKFEGTENVFTNATAYNSSYTKFVFAENAVLTAPEVFNVDKTTDAEGYDVIYKDDAYRVAKVEIAAIGNVTYASLPEAVAAAQEGQTIKLLCDAEGPGVVIDKSININFGGHTYTFTEGVGSTGTESNGFQILKGNTVKLTDGTLKVAEEAASKFYILIQNYADLTVQRITLDGTNLDKWSKTDTDGDSYVLSNNSGYVQIKAGTKFIVNDDGDKAFAFDVCDQTAKGYDLPLVKLDVKVDKKYIEAVAYSGSNYFANLQQAVNAGGTITVLRDSSGSGVVINNDVNIDFGGYTYTLTEGVGSTGTESNGFQILKGNTVVMRNGTVKVADEAASKFYILIQNYADLSTSNITLDGTNLDKWSKTDGDSYVVSNNSGNVSIGSGTTIIANDEGALAFAFDACDKSAWGYELPVVEVHLKAVINGNIEAAAKIGNTYYATLQQAIEAATDGQTVTLFNDIKVDAADAVKTSDNLNVMFKVEGKSITLDMNGKTINAKYDSAEMLYAVVYVEDGASLTVKGEGKINLTTGDTLASNMDCVAYLFWKRGTTGALTIENGTYTANKLEDSMVYTNGDKIVTVKGGTWTLVNVDSQENGCPWIFNAAGKNENSVVVSGGTYNFDVSNQYWAHEVYIPENMAVVANGDGTWTVTDAEVYIVGETRNVGYATFKDAVASIAKGDPETTIVLNKNITVKGQFIGHSYAQKVVINLNGYTMSSTDKALTVYRGGTEVTIKNGTISGNTTGGTIQVTYGGKLILGENLVVKAGGQATAINLDNGTLITNGQNISVPTGKRSVYVNTAKSNTIALSAGTYKTEILADWCAEGYAPVQNEDGTWTIVEDLTSGKVAKIGDTYYETLAAAIAAAEDDNTITVLENIDLANEKLSDSKLDGAYNTYYKVEDKTITIDLNGKTISGEYTGEEMLVGVFSTENNGHLTLTGNGTVNVTATATVYSLVANYEDGSTITIKNGSYTLDKAGDSLLYTGGNEGLIVEGGNFTLGNVGTGSNGKPWIFNGLGQNETHSIVTGGTYNADVGSQYWVHEVEIPVGYTVKDLGNGTFEVIKDDRPVVAVIANTKYVSLADAIEAAKNKDVIKLLKDIEVDTSAIVTNSGGYATIYNIAEKAITIDLNGKTITATVKAAEVANANGSMLLGVFAVDTNGSLTLTGNGTVTANAVGASMNSDDSHLYSLMIAYGEGSKLVVENGTYSANSVSSALVYSQYDEIITINGGTYTLGNLGTDANGSPWLFNAKGQNTQNIIVNGGSFSADIQHQYYPFEVKMPKEKALKLENGMYTVVDAVAYVTEREWSSKWYTNNVGYATLEEAIEACEGPKTRGGLTSEQEEIIILGAAEAATAGALVSAIVVDGKNNVALSENIVVEANIEMLLEADGELGFDGNGKTITTNGTGTAPGESYDYGYVGFIPANGEDAVVSNVTVTGSGFVEVGHYGVSTGGNYSITNLTIANLVATLAVNNGGNNIAAAFSHYGNATLTNCVMTGTTTAKEGYKPYDAAFVNGTKTTIVGGQYGKVYLAHQAHVTITNAVIKEIDSCAITTRNLGKLTIGAGAKIGTINLTPGSYTPALVIEDGAEVGAIVYNGITYTVAEWNAR